jgi:internalin A
MTLTSLILNILSRKPVLLIALITLQLSACSGYRVVLNNNVLYSPNGMPVTPSLLSDANLQGCLNQLFNSSGNDDPESITLLACPSSGVQSLTGIGALPNLEQLELSDNTISDLSPLQNLRNLRVLSIRNNRINNINTLMSLPILRFVALQGNNTISCRQLDDLETKIGNSLNRPANCSS